MLSPHHEFVRKKFPCTLPKSWICALVAQFNPVSLTDDLETQSPEHALRSRRLAGNVYNKGRYSGVF